MIDFYFMSQLSKQYRILIFFISFSYTLLSFLDTFVIKKKKENFLDMRTHQLLMWTDALDKNFPNKSRSFRSKK